MSKESQLLQELQLRQRFCFTCLPHASAACVYHVHLPHASTTCICHMHLPRTSAVRICHIFGSNASLCSQKSNPATLSCLMYKIFQITESRIEIATFLSLISNSIIEIRHILASYAQI